MENSRPRRRTLTGIMVIASWLFGVLAVWSALDPGSFYLYRAALFVVLGAVGTYIAALPRFPRHAPTLAILFVAVVLTVVAVVEGTTAPPDQVESINLFLIPLVLITSALAAFTWMVRRP